MTAWSGGGGGGGAQPHTSLGGTTAGPRSPSALTRDLDKSFPPTVNVWRDQITHTFLATVWWGEASLPPAAQARPTRRWLVLKDRPQARH